MKRTVKNVYMGIIFLFLYAPIILLIIFSFNNSKSRNNWGGFTLKWYHNLFGNSEIMTALVNTLTIALIAAVVATIIGTIAAIGMHSMRSLPRNTLLNVTYLPVLNPDIVTGIALLLLFAFLGIKFGYFSLLLAHISFCIPYVILSVLPKLRQMNVNLYEAALDLGAHPFAALRKVILPEIMPGVLSGFLMAITLSIDDFVISFFTTGPGVSNLSITIFSMTRKGIKPEINALSTLLFLAVLILLLVINRSSFKLPEKKHINSANPQI